MVRIAHNFIDLAGNRYGKLFVVSRSEESKRGVAMWLCRCDCGKENAIRSQDLRNGKTTSCGCNFLHHAKSQPKGEFSKSWKGGYTTPQGYVVIGKGKNRLAHRQVMAALLGRELKEYETVHHKNGIRNDNRPENLELWSSRHCKGQRVADHIEFAVALLKEYAPDKLAAGV